jgi:hypothetical protein
MLRAYNYEHALGLLLIWQACFSPRRASLFRDEFIRVGSFQDSQGLRAPVSALPTMWNHLFFLSELMHSILYASLPVLAQGRNWVLPYKFNMSLILICSDF